MTIFAQSEIWFLLLVAGGTGLGYCLARLKDRGARAYLDVLIRDRLKNAEAEAQNILREARLSADEEGLKLRRETEESFTVRLNELEQAERQRGEREAMLNSQMEGMVERERSLAGQQSRLLQKETELQERKQQLKELIAERREQLAKIAQLSQD